MKFILEQSEENITTHSGLSLVGLLVSKTSLKERLNRTSFPGVTAPEISQVNNLINRTANALLDLGLRQGDKIVLHLPNCPELRHKAPF